MMEEKLVLKATSRNTDRSGKAVSYTLMDESGKTLEVSCQKIVTAILKGKVDIINIALDSETHDIVYVDINEAGKPSGASRQSKRSGEDGMRRAEAASSIKPSEPIKMTEHVGTGKSDMDIMRELVAKINKARRVYEQGTDEIMSNKEYDALCDKLAVLESKLGVVLPDSPSINVGYEVLSELEKEKHSEPMLSLAKTKSVDDVASFVGNHDALLSLKMDGLTVVMTYDKGEIVKAVTRGNGDIGEVVTANAKQFKNLPRKIPFKGRLIVRGEALIKYKDFERINASIYDESEKYKNPRNLCSGTVRQLDTSITAKRNVNWIAFTLVDAEGKQFKLVSEQLEFLRGNGFDTVDINIVNGSTVQEAIGKYERKLESGEVDIPSDGLVAIYNDIAYGKSLGNTAKSPRHSLAFKWRDEEEETVLKYIEWSASRTGLINPVAVFEPVDIDGSTVSRASVHNISILRNLKLGYGDKIMVYKANKIIPQISENLTQSNSCEIPSRCPVCRGETNIREDDRSGVLTLWCDNEFCEAKGIKLLAHFVSRDAMNIVGLSEQTLMKFQDMGIVDKPSSIYSIYKYKDEIVEMEGFGYKSYEKIVSAIEDSRHVKLANFIYALGIPNIGLATAKLICKSFDNDVKRVVNAKVESLLNIDGIGDVIAESFYSYFRLEEDREEFLRLLKEVEFVTEEAPSNDSLKGLSICVTGAVRRFKSRNHVKEVVESMGGKLTGSVSQSTAFLVTNDTGSGSRKNIAAQEYGIPILSEDEFIEKLGIDI